MKIAVAGCGYVGLVTGACLANLGNDVICVDIDDERISNLRRGIMPFFEPELREIVEINSKQKRLMFTTDVQLTVENSDVIFITVGTPLDENGRSDTSSIFQFAESFAKFINGYKLLVVKSTVPIGTTHKLKDYLSEKIKNKQKFDVASNPEFLKEGEAVRDFLIPDRVVIGVDNDKTRETLINIYKTIERTNRPIVITDIKTSELIKYASNAMLASRISFMNNLSELCEKVGADVKTIARGIGLDRRIGTRFLQAGIGYGGSCFPKDVSTLSQIMKDHGVSGDLLDAVQSINNKQKTCIIPKIQKLVPEIKGKKIAIWGLSFKPKTDDIREAPSVTIIKELQKLGAIVKSFDPVSEDSARKTLKNVEFSDTPFKAIEGTHGLVIATEWDLFRELDKRKMKDLMAAPNIFDGRNIYDPEDFKKLGFNYVGIGRGA